jgi:sulfur-carrier protein adenylyltransferase/sulfurtransferase
MLGQLLDPFRSLFDGVTEMSPDQVRGYLDSHRADEFTLLDVRQPAEYIGGHLPGARLIPLPELADRLGELERAKPIIAY